MITDSSSLIVSSADLLFLRSTDNSSQHLFLYPVLVPVVATDWKLVDRKLSS